MASETKADALTLALETYFDTGGFAPVQLALKGFQMSQTNQGSQSLLFIRTTVLAAILLGIVASLTGASAGQDKNGGLKTAVVNPRKLVNDYKFAITTREKLTAMEQEAKDSLEVWGQFQLLESAEQDTLVKLIQKERSTNPATAITKPEADQLAALKDKHKRLSAEFAALSSKSNADTTPADAKQFESLNKKRTDTQLRGKKLNETATETLQKEQDKANIQIDKDIRDVLNKFCKEKGYNLVFSNEVVLFADSDITEDVLKKLNSGN